MNRLEHYRAALFGALLALCCLTVVCCTQWTMITLRDQWGNEDARIIQDQEATIEGLRDEVATQHKARVADAARLAEYQRQITDLADEHPSPGSWSLLGSRLQYRLAEEQKNQVRDREARLKAYEAAYPEPDSAKQMRQRRAEQEAFYEQKRRAFLEYLRKEGL